MLLHLLLFLNLWFIINLWPPISVLYLGLRNELPDGGKLFSLPHFHGRVNNSMVFLWSFLDAVRMTMPTAFFLMELLSGILSLGNVFLSHSSKLLQIQSWQVLFVYRAFIRISSMLFFSFFFRLCFLEIYPLLCLNSLLWSELD